MNTTVGRFRDEMRLGHLQKCHAALQPLLSAVLVALCFYSQFLLQSLSAQTPVRGGLRDIKGGDRHTEMVFLSAGYYFSALVEQHGIDLVIAIYNPDGKLLAKANRPIGSQGKEQIHCLSDEAGLYILEVRAANETARPGRYELTIFPAHPTQAKDRQLVRAQNALGEGDRLRASGIKQQGQASVAAFQAAIDDFQAAGDQAGAAVALIGKGRTLHFMGQPKSALECFEQARALFKQAGDKNGETLAVYRLGGVMQTLAMPQSTEHLRLALEMAQATDNDSLKAQILTNLGYGSWVRGDLSAALKYLEESLGLQRALGDRYGEAEAMYQIAGILSDQGEYQRGLEYYLETVRLHRLGGYRREEINSLVGLADAYRFVGDTESALEALSQALQLVRNSGYLTTEAVARLKLGDLFLQSSQPGSALEQFSRALSLVEESSYTYLVPRVFRYIGQAHAALRNHKQALDFFGRAIAAYEGQKQVSGQIEVFYARGLVYYATGRIQQALAEFNMAAAKYQEMGDRLGLARTQVAVARAQATQGQLAVALDYNATALTLLESLRSNLRSYEQRATFFATVADAYEQGIELLMRRHEQDLGVGHDRTALELSERARARSLLEMLSGASVELGLGSASAPPADVRDLQQQINDEAARRANLMSKGNSSEEIAAIDARLRELTNKLNQTGIRRVTSERNHNVLVRPLAIIDIQRLLDADTVLIEYALGEQRSFVWVVTPTTVNGYGLPARSVIERQVRQVIGLLIMRAQQRPNETTEQKLIRAVAADKQFTVAAAGLSRLLLAPAATQLTNKRLLFVAPGELQYVPFAALPEPGVGVGAKGAKLNATYPYSPLIIRHEIVNLPSASVLAVMRSETTSRLSAPQAIAVLADPVFGEDDERAKAASAARVGAGRQGVTSRADSLPPELERSLRNLRGNARDGLVRLPYSGNEAEEIAAMVPTGDVLKATGFQATRALATSDKMRLYRVIHFATHGLLDNQHPELSGLVLSLIDETGQAQDGFLRLHEIYNLNLNADLVVLSACQTALGKDIKGEGLIGLTRGFFNAGARRVVASLWQVNDSATAALMKHFYRGIMWEHLAPAAALRAAQIEMLNKRDRQAPFFWAAFIIQGEWR